MSPFTIFAILQFQEGNHTPSTNPTSWDMQCILRYMYHQMLIQSLKGHLSFVTVHGQIGHNAQKRENRVFLQHHSSGTTVSSELFRGMAVIEG